MKRISLRMRCRFARTGLTLFCFVVFAAGAYGQQAKKTFFVYLQNETGTPFYVKNGDSLMSSSPAGYMIIPRLQKGQYRFTVGFPKNQMPEASFDVKVSGSADQGFLIRKAGGGFDLVSMQDSHVLEPVATASAPGNRIVEAPAIASAPPKRVVKKHPASPPSSPASSPALAAGQDSVPPPAPAAKDTGAFSRMLNQITGGSRPEAGASPEQPAPDSGQEVAETADTPAAPPTVPDTGKKTKSGPEDQETAVTAPPVQKAPPPSSGEPQFITFSTDSGEAPETVPSAPAIDNGSASDSAQEVRRKERELRREARDREKAAEQSTDTADVLSPFIPESKPAEQRVASKANAADTLQAIPNSDCSKVAGEDDFQKVRRKMASRSSEQSMFNVAEKYFGGGLCYTTSQIQSLTYLFMTDEYKYKFLELAYPHTADTRNFPSLIGTLGGAYYRDRFKAMMK